MRARGLTVGMRALLLRRTAFVATLATGLSLTVAGVLGLSGMGRDLEVAAVRTQAKPALVADRHECPAQQRSDWRS